MSVTTPPPADMGPASPPPGSPARPAASGRVSVAPATPGPASVTPGPAAGALAGLVDEARVVLRQLAEEQRLQGLRHPHDAYDVLAALVALVEPDAGWVPVLSFAVGGPPVGAQRPRLSTIGGHARAHMSAAHREAEGGLSTAAWVEWQRGWVATREPPTGMRPVLDEPVRVDVVLVAARPQRLLRKRDPDGRIPRATGKPDADNAAKLVMDALVRAQVLRDDTLVCDLRVVRVYAARAEGAATEVVVSAWRAT